MNTALAIHASAVAINGRALLILGRSGSGKSSLAARLIGDAPAGLCTRLIGDDRILLSIDGTGTALARPHPRTAGFIERRGFGFVWLGFVPQAPVEAMVLLGDAAAPTTLAHRRTLRFHGEHASTESMAAQTFAWWRRLARGTGTTAPRENEISRTPSGKDHHCSTIIV